MARINGGTSGGGGGGNITGSGGNDQIARFTSSTNITSDGNFTYDGNGLVQLTRQDDSNDTRFEIRRARSGNADIQGGDTAGELHLQGRLGGGWQDFFTMTGIHGGSGGFGRFQVWTGSGMIDALTLDGFSRGAFTKFFWQLEKNTNDDQAPSVIFYKDRADGYGPIQTNDALGKIFFDGNLGSQVGLNYITCRYIGSGTDPDYRTKFELGFQDVLGNAETAFIGPKSFRRYFETVAFDFTVDVTTGDGAAYIHVPAGYDLMALKEVHALVITAGTTGTTDVQLANVTQAVDMLSTKITIDSGETGSDTAAVPPVIDAGNRIVHENDILRVDVDAVSTTAPKGLIVTMGFE